MAGDRDSLCVTNDERPRALVHSIPKFRLVIAGQPIIFSANSRADARAFKDAAG